MPSGTCLGPTAADRQMPQLMPRLTVSAWQRGAACQQKPNMCYLILQVHAERAEDSGGGPVCGGAGGRRGVSDAVCARLAGARLELGLRPAAAGAAGHPGRRQQPEVRPARKLLCIPQDGIALLSHLLSQWPT